MECRLADLMATATVRLVRGSTDIPVQNLVYDSRQVGPGSVFFCLTGLGQDRHAFIPDACARGAAALVVERETLLPAFPPGPTILLAADARRALAEMAVAFYGHPSQAVTLIGVTGTNGKTTTTYFLEAIWRATGQCVMRVGTVAISIDGQERPPTATTPEAVDLQALLAEARDRALQAAVLEVSSHALALGRVEGCRFAAAVLTNVTQDHLDFHHTMEAYAAAKRRLFEPEPDGYAGPATWRILNQDDPWAQQWMTAGWPQVRTYGLSGAPDLRAEDVRLQPKRTSFTLWEDQRPVAQVTLALSGRYNVSNALAAAATARALHTPWDAVLSGLQSLRCVPGRLERIDEGQPFAVLVDYAHTPDALQRLLAAVREMQPRRLITVFGCGGDRDRTKRPQMGRLAAESSDVCILTSDNPRTEDPERILDDIEAGIPAARRSHVQREVDRTRAIHLALQMAQPGDAVVIAGKGHETVQIVGQERHPFDDREVARRLLLQVIGPTSGSGG